MLCLMILIMCFNTSCQNDNDTKESYLQEGSVINYEDIPYYYFNDPVEKSNCDTSYMESIKKEYKEYSYNDDGDKIIYRDYLDGVEIVKYDGWDNVLKIPETIDGKPVIKLGGYLDDSDEETIGYALYSCIFTDKIEVQEIYIPSKVKEIVYDTFCDVDGGYDLQKIKVSKDNPYYSSKDGILYNKDGTIKLCVPNSYK